MPCGGGEVVVLRQHLCLRMETDAIKFDVLPIAVVYVHLAIADARVALGVVVKHAMGECYSLLVVVLIMACSRVCDAHLVMVVQLYPGHCDKVRAVGYVEQTIVGVAEVAMINPYVMAVVESHAVDTSACKPYVADDDTPTILH